MSNGIVLPWPIQILKKIVTAMKCIALTLAERNQQIFRKYF